MYRMGGSLLLGMLLLLGAAGGAHAKPQATVILDSYTLLNARLSWDAPVRIGGSSEGLRFSVYGKNLLDEDVEVTFLPIDMTLPGSTYYGTVEVRF